MRLFTTLLEVVGMAAVTAGAGLVSLWLGLVVGGLCLIVLGGFLGRSA